MHIMLCSIQRHSVLILVLTVKTTVTVFRMIKKSIFIFSLCCIYLTASFPTGSLVVSSTENTKEGGSDNHDVSKVASPPQIYEMDVHANVSNRFGKTLITSKVRNPATTAQEVTFSVILPESAYISEFIMEICGKQYKAYVKEKEEAKQIYDNAVASGIGAAHVAVSARDSNRFTVSVNVEAEGKAIFYLTYEELLQRKNDMYEIVINIHPGQIVKHLGIKVDINESKTLRFVRTPNLRSGNEITKNEEGLAPNTNIDRVNDTTVVVTFNPDMEQQEQFAEKLGTEKENGLSGQFVVQYDVDRDSQGGEVLVKDGYFVHFFAPKDLEPLPKQVVFVLDNSGSMGGSKFDQLKKAMDSILTELKPTDSFNIIDFDDTVRIWDFKNSEYKPFGESPIPELDKLNKDSAILDATAADADNVKKAKELVERLPLGGSTNIIGGLEAGIYLVHNARNIDRSKYQPMIIFLTDGEPNVRLYDSQSIIDEVEKLNNENRIPIFTLSFGEYADKNFLRKLSLNNLGFSRHIYVAADAHLQLQDFYHEISSPLLHDVDFEYVDKDVQDITQTKFFIYFGGSEFVVAGRYPSDTIDPGFAPHVWGNGPNGRIDLIPVRVNAVTELERLWAYLTIRQKLEERDASDNKKELEKQALDLALKYSFVTPVSSLVVVKPNETSSVDTENSASKFGSGLIDIRVDSGDYDDYMYSYTNALDPGLAEDYYPSTPYEGDVDTTESSTFTPEIATPNVTSIEELKTKLPWLADILDADEKFVVQRKPYKLGLGETASTSPKCGNNPSGGEGTCVLLHQCPEAFQFLDDFTKYENSFCPLNEYAGVCCPSAQVGAK